MKTAQKIVVMLAATFTAGLLFVNIYNSVVDAPNWGRDIPASLEAARAYFKVSHPGVFFRVASPMNQGLALLALILCWRLGKTARIYLALALVVAVGADALTFAYFYPRNAIMFGYPPNTDVEALKAAWSEWSFMNWVRSAVCTIPLICDFAALSIILKRG